MQVASVSDSFRQGITIDSSQFPFRHSDADIMLLCFFLSAVAFSRVFRVLYSERAVFSSA